MESLCLEPGGSNNKVLFLTFQLAWRPALGIFLNASTSLKVIDLPWNWFTSTGKILGYTKVVLVDLASSGPEGGNCQPGGGGKDFFSVGRPFQIMRQMLSPLKLPRWSKLCCQIPRTHGEKRVAQE